MLVNLDNFLNKLDLEYIKDFINTSPSANGNQTAGSNMKSNKKSSIYRSTQEMHDLIFSSINKDRLYSETNAHTQELRFDYTNQITDKWRSRVGIDYKTHKLEKLFKTFKLNTKLYYLKNFQDYGKNNYLYIRNLQSLHRIKSRIS